MSTDPMDVDTTTRWMMQETGHACPADPMVVRNLAACAHNALGSWKANERSAPRKMRDLEEALAAFKVYSDAHFEALKDWRRP